MSFSETVGVDKVKEQRDEAMREPAEGAAVREKAQGRKLIGRRALIRGAGVAVPTILTLNSGVAAALARSSNLIGAKLQGAPPGDKLCLDVGQYDPVAGSSPGSVKYDLGPNPDLDVVKIPDGSLEYRIIAEGGGPTVGAEYVCVNDGPFEYREAGSASDFQPLSSTSKPSVLVSATALQSFAGRYTVTDIRDL